MALLIDENSANSSAPLDYTTATDASGQGSFTENSPDGMTLSNFGHALEEFFRLTGTILVPSVRMDGTVWPLGK